MITISDFPSLLRRFRASVAVYLQINLEPEHSRKLLHLDPCLDSHLRRCVMIPELDIHTGRLHGQGFLQRLRIGLFIGIDIGEALHAKLRRGLKQFPRGPRTNNLESRFLNNLHALARGQLCFCGRPITHRPVKGDKTDLWKGNFLTHKIMSGIYNLRVPLSRSNF